MKLIFKSNGKEFNLPREIGEALIAISGGQLTEKPKESLAFKAPQFNPQPVWAIVRGTQTGRPILQGRCSSCGLVASADRPASAKTLFLTHCGVAKDCPPAKLVKEFCKRFEPLKPPIQREIVPVDLVGTSTILR
jgi:hypothetical protein